MTPVPVHRRRRRIATGLALATLWALLLAPAGPALARVRLENICSIYGQREIRLTGIGLVVGLDGTGDGGKDIHSMRALAAALKLFNSPVMTAEELKNANNVAIVLIEATIPKTGLRRGQKLDCYVSSIKGAKSLRGGRLLVSPLETSDLRNNTPVALASGAIAIEDQEVQTTGMIPGGIVLIDDFISHFINVKDGNVITLLLDQDHASFPVAYEVARAINDEFKLEAYYQDVARPVGPGAIEIRPPQAYLTSPVEFVAKILDVRIDNPQSQARVVVNSRTGVVLVSGEVEISPVVISHKNLTVQVGGRPGPGDVSGAFVALTDQPQQEATDQLQQLLNALNELKVPKEDVISIVRELQRSGKLHAIYEEH
jgi:flagellar P-ring protein precursor FlgI